MAKIFALRRLSTLALRQRRQRLLHQLSLPPNLIRASIVERFNTCGKPNCARARGQKHGPFYYLTQCLAAGKANKFLLKTTQGREAARAAAAAFNDFYDGMEELSQINALLDLEPIRPGEEECTAALRLLGRPRRIYGPRFIDAITLDAWHVQGPFPRAVRRLGWQWVVVFKRERMEAYQEALQLSRGQKPVLAFEDKERAKQVQLWEVKDPHFSESHGRPFRVVRSEEQWAETRVRGGIKSRKPRQSQWLWGASEGLDGHGAQLIYQAGHRRWGIENKAFNELTQAYHLEHCYHHEPASMPAQMLILLLGFTLFTALAQLHNKRVRLGALTAKALTKELDLALEEDLPWEQWFQSG